jgi:dimethylargininase
LLSRAIVRPPSSNFADGLTTADLGAPDHERAMTQHAAYCEALERCGLAVTRLPEDPRHPDSTFVEDTAILTARGAILTRPGAPSRTGEVEGIRGSLSGFYPAFREIAAPGTLDGGDVCEAEGRFLIGISGRTNEEGARQLAAFLDADGFTSSLVDIRDIDGILHLKSGIAYLGDGRVVAIGALRRHPVLRDYEIIPVDASETFAANCVRVNERLLVAAGHPRLTAALGRIGYDVLPLEMSEFEKMDGGLSCLSLRF